MKHNAKTAKKALLGQSARTKIANGVIYFVLATLGILWVTPIVFLVYTSLRVTPNTEIGRAHV